MWVLIQEPMSGGAIDVTECGLVQWGLVPGQTYTVGRVEGEVLCAKDSSVSKTHARITVLSGGNGDRPEVMLEDVGSKYGTHLNDGILAESQRLADNDGKISRALKKPVKLKDNDRMRFGVAYSIFRLKWISLVVTSSMLNDKKVLNSWLMEIETGTKVQSQWNDTITHLAMNTISLSIKVVNCLAKGVPIVTPEYFRDYNSSLKSKQRLPSVTEYTPQVSQSDSESQLRDPQISFQINNDRSHLFTGKTFVFLEPKQQAENLPPITLSGGTAMLWTDATPLDTITSDHIVIKPKGVTNSQSQMTPASSSLWNTLSAVLAKQSLVSCPATNIYLAIVHSSIANFCNPSRRPSSVVPPVIPTQAKQSYPVRAPETLSTMSTLGLVTTNPLSNKVSETLSTKGSDIFKTPQAKANVKTTAAANIEILEAESQTQICEANLGETQAPFLTPVETSKLRTTDIPDINSSTRTAKKRGRVSSDEDNLEMDTSTVPLAKKPFSQTTNDAEGDIYGTGKENIVNNSCQSTEALKDSVPNPPDNDEADIFGLNAHDKNSKKRILSDTETVPIQSQEKRARHSSGDDIFGFGEPSNSKVSKTFENSSKKSDNSLKALDRDDEDLFGFEEPPKKAKKMFNPISQENNKGSSSSVSVSTARTISTYAEDENQNMTAGLKVSNITKFESTGFLGKEDITIKSEVKTEYVEDTSGDVSALSASLVKVTLLNLFRPSTPKPSYVPSPNPEHLGKPVVNYKRFKKQSVDKSRAVISLVKYVPSDLNQTGIDEWFNQNKDVTRREQEREVLDKQSEDFWNFHNSQSQGKMKNPFSRSTQNIKKKY
eukprot:GFUD01117184.1.p1 GENE.GFUD01117184.1~~GFUD01117184.1.p1  ORF type:complete len:829 (+),score=224.00 GFUD01117184.1:76-2562(+)